MLLITLVFLVFGMPVFSKDFVCKVKSVHDGDTFTCANKVKIRVWGIDTPEVPPKVTKQEAANNGGYKARDFLESYILKKRLACRPKGKSFDRVVAQCYYNGTDIAVPLLKKAMAKEAKKYSKNYYTELISFK